MGDLRPDDSKDMSFNHERTDVILTCTVLPKRDESMWMRKGSKGSLMAKKRNGRREGEKRIGDILHTANLGLALDIARPDMLANVVSEDHATLKLANSVHGCHALSPVMRGSSYGHRTARPQLLLAFKVAIYSDQKGKGSEE